MMNHLLSLKNLISQQFFKPILQSAPGLYLRLQRFRYRGKNFQKKLVTKNTDLVIEGFPRSANSFAVKAFQYVNGKSYNIATHLHAYPQVIKALEYNVPTLLLIREPSACIISLQAFRVQNLGKKRVEQSPEINWILKDYIRFYKKLLPFKDQVVLGKFDDVSNDYGRVLERVNEKFKTDFKVFEHSKENLKEVFGMSKKHLFPSEEREQLKLDYRDKVKALSSSKVFLEAQEIYNKWCN